MQLLPCLLDVEIQGNIILSEIFQLEEWRYHVMIGLVEYDDFPNVICLWKYLCKKVFLLFDKIDFWVCEGDHLMVIEMTKYANRRVYKSLSIDRCWVWVGF